MNTDQLIDEVSFKAVRSSGAGGQHVNKVSTKVVLVFDIQSSRALSAEEKDLLISNLGPRLSRDKTIVVQSADTRSQVKNRAIALNKMLELIHSGLVVPTQRKKTKPSRKVREKRLSAKRRKSEKKLQRKKPDPDM